MKRSEHSKRSSKQKEKNGQTLERFELAMPMSAVAATLVATRHMPLTERLPTAHAPENARSFGPEFQHLRPDTSGGSPKADLVCLGAASEARQRVETRQEEAWAPPKF
ncbi:MAG: hypothetical protein GY811_24580 [Myxococcales bacterium]|nr:hypothetical protein [Myxococcales bacterium]